MIEAMVEVMVETAAGVKRSAASLALCVALATVALAASGCTSDECVFAANAECELETGLGEPCTEERRQEKEALCDSAGL